MKGNSDLKAIGKRITEQRLKKHLTQAELGKALCVSREIISYWENGNRDIKTGDIVLLAEALDTTCDYLLRGTELKNADIYKETGLSNAAINNLREIAQFSTESNPLFSALDSFLTSDDLEGFLLYFYQFQSAVWSLSSNISALLGVMDNSSQKKPKDIIKHARSIQEDDPYFHETYSVASDYESLDYYLFKMQNVIKDISDNYRDKILTEDENGSIAKSQR